MTTLADFLLARIAEDEAAVECIETVTYRDRWFTHPSGEVNHISPHGLLLHGRRRLLAECEAKRRIVEHHAGLTGDDAGQGYTSEGYGFVDPCCVSCGTSDEYAEPWPCPTIKALALPYADHPDYRESWRP